MAVVLVGVSQLIEEEGYKELDLPYWEPGVGALPWTFSGEGKMKKKKMSMGLGDSGEPVCCELPCPEAKYQCGNNPGGGCTQVACGSPNSTYSDGGDGDGCYNCG